VAKRDILLKFTKRVGSLSQPPKARQLVFRSGSCTLYLSPAVVWAKAAEASSFDNASQWLFLYQMQEKMNFANLLYQSWGPFPDCAVVVRM
jgi:hypothetical protein